MNTTAFARGVADATPHVYCGDGGDHRHAAVRRLYRRACHRLPDPTAGHPYAPGEWDRLVEAGRRWALDRLAG